MMRRRTFFRVSTGLLLLAAVALVVPACGGGGGSGGRNSKDLVLKKFLLVDENLQNLGGTGTTNAFRDTRILFVFNTKVNPVTANARTIRIGIPTGGGLFLAATGRFETVEGHPNWIVFNPTVSENGVPNPFALDGNAHYEVDIPAVGDAGKLVENARHKPIVKSFSAQFQTSDQYLQNFVQPELLSTEPYDGQTEVSSSADIVLKFTAPMKPDSFKLGSSFIVRNLTTGRSVLGTLRFSTDAKTVTFRPVFGYGKGPFDIFVRVTKEVTNLPGNKIPKEVRFTFTTEFDPTAQSFNDITEEFDSKTYEDTSYQNVFPRAAWNVGVTSGFLAGVSVSGSVTIQPSTNSYSWAPWCFGTATQWQSMWQSSEIGTARTITGFDWYKWCYTSNTISAVSMKMGHTKTGTLTTNFASNYSDTPVTVLNPTNYAISNAPSMNWVAAPTFTGFFKYNGSDNIILEINHKGASVAWTNGTATRMGLWRTAPNDPLVRVAYTAPAGFPGGSPQTNNYHQWVRFYYLVSQSEAQSKWYDTGIKSPTYLEVILSPSLPDQPAGTQTTMTFQGATEDPLNPGHADLTNLSVWVDDLVKISGLRFVRFHVDFKANELTGQQPSIDRLVIPYMYF